MSRFDVAYPLIGAEYLYGHHRLPRWAANATTRNLQDFEERISVLEESTVILSSEGFDTLKPEGIAILAANLPDSRKVKIVYFRRNPTDLLVSAWQEAVKHGETQSFFEFAEPHITRPFISHLMNDCLVLDRFRDQFGISAIHVVDYDKAAAAGDIFGAFCTAVGHPEMMEIGEFSIANKSKSVWEIELLRIFNTMAGYDGLLHGSNVRQGWREFKRAHRRDNDFKLLLQELSDLIRYKIREFSMRNSPITQILDTHFIGTYGAQLQPADLAAPVQIEFKTHRLCETQWLSISRAHEIVSKLYGAFQSEIKAADAIEHGNS